MDQDSFRRLLQTPHTASASPASGPRGFFTSSSKAKAKVIDPSQPAFKPRKVKKTTEGQYRDRAAERRVGEGNDYAQVEAVLEDFEKRNAGQDKSTLDAQRRYLGGDGAHSVLVKGLDTALLEQNRARAAALSTEDDESLEKAFLEATTADTPAETQTQVPKKRTREELLRELKEKRAQPAEGAGKFKTAEEEARLLEQAKQAGKFRPIGFKPIGAAASAEQGKVKKKKKKAKAKGEEGQVEGERKKKKRKVAEAVEEGTKGPKATMAATMATTTQAQAVPPPKPAAPKPESEPEALLEDLDIFADAGEYEGLQLDDSESEGEAAGPSKPQDLEEGGEEVREEEVPPPPSIPRRWIDTGSPEPEATPPAKPDLLSSVLGTTASTSTFAPKGPERERERDQEEEGEVDQPPARLVPLASSALPSIKDFLAMEQAASAGAGKRRKRKGGGGEKKGTDGGEEGKKRSAEAKAERDYKRLKSYTDKKAAT